MYHAYWGRNNRGASLLVLNISFSKIENPWTVQSSSKSLGTSSVPYKRAELFLQNVWEKPRCEKRSFVMCTEGNRLPFVIKSKITSRSLSACLAICRVSFHLLPSMGNGNRLPSVDLCVVTLYYAKVKCTVCNKWIVPRNVADSPLWYVVEISYISDWNSIGSPWA